MLFTFALNLTAFQVSPILSMQAFILRKFLVPLTQAQFFLNERGFMYLDWILTLFMGIVGSLSIMLLITPCYFPLL